MNNIMFFDCETNGLPKDWRAPMQDLDNWPRVIQLAWATYNHNGESQLAACDMILPDGWVIPQQQFWIENGYSTERSMELGKPIIMVLDKFVRALQDCDVIVSHNMSFDYNVVGAEMLRAGIKSENRPIRICTKEATTEWCQIPFPGRKQYPGMGRQTYKWPKLSELHEKIFGTGFDGAHDAMADVEALKNCFFKLMDLKIINL